LDAVVTACVERWQHTLYFLLLPQGHASLRPTFDALIGVGLI
jgi:hypothetical protein